LQHTIEEHEGEESAWTMKNWPGFNRRRSVVLVLALGLVFWLVPEMARASTGHSESALLASVSISILAATVCAYAATLVKQPLILAYIAAGMIVGPEIGLALVQSKSDIQTIAEIGLILLLFMIGLELDLRKLKEAGKSLIVTGVFQFILCILMGLGFFFLLGFSLGGQAPITYSILGVQILGGPYDLLYLAVCISLSSTAIVVKLLYEKFELDTLAGRLTLGVLVFQDLWAIIVLSVQPNLAHPHVVMILQSFMMAALLVLFSFLMSKYVLGFIFRGIAKQPEIMLVASLGWCFLIAGLAGYLGLSMEMGALIAGVALSTFPYNVDIIGKIVNIRDFFLTLFFVALGMIIPNPLAKPGLLMIAGCAAGFLVLTRFFSIYPILYSLGNGNRVSLLSSLNLSQISEFALVIAVIGLKPGNAHIGRDIATIIIFVFVLTSIASTYMIKYNQGIVSWLRRGVEKVGLKSLDQTTQDARPSLHPEIALLGFYRVASAFLAEVENSRPQLKEKLVVVDFNPEVFRALKARGVNVVYGDISNMPTLHHAGIDEAKLVISTITDDILVGTDNFRLIGQIRKMCPQAKVVVTAGSPSQALRLYKAGADYVLRPNSVAGHSLLKVLDLLMHREVADLVKDEIDHLSQQKEVLA
jgi:Kef-type K+ transport system membrane component KefB